MHWGSSWHTGWFFGMHLLWWAFWIAVILCAWVVVARSGTSTWVSGDTPLAILKRRYAQGSLTTAEFEEQRAKLMEEVAASH